MGKSSSGDVRSLMEMSDRERDGFLREQGVGVLSLARDRRSYAFPVSYGYDASESLVAVMLGYAPDSEKRRWVKETEVATLVAHEMCDDGEAASVVVRGALVEAGDDEVATATKRCRKTPSSPSDTSRARVWRTRSTSSTGSR